MKGFDRFVRGMLRMPLGWQLWLAVLGAANLVAPLFFLDRLEAGVVLGVFLVAGTLMGLLTARFGFSRILGAGHSPWLVLLPWLWTRLPEATLLPLDGDAFGWWLRAVLVVNTLSLMIDATDVVRWVRGEREETVEGLG